MCMWGVKTLKIYPLSQFQVYNTVWLTTSHHAVHEIPELNHLV